MNIIDYIGIKIFQRRYNNMQSWMKGGVVAQEKIFKKLIAEGKDTEWGQKYYYDAISSYEDFSRTVPISSYEEIFPQIERMSKGEQQILCPDPINLFAKSSGTTNGRSKFVPLSKRSLHNNHFQGGRDMIALYVHNVSRTQIFSGRHVSLGGSLQPITTGDVTVMTGDVSALVMSSLPWWAKYISTPSHTISLLPNWEDKSVRMARAIKDKNITSLAGVPTWTVHLCKEVSMQKNVSTVDQVWPNIEVFFHGGVSFVPYHPLFSSIMGGKKINYMETYNASEGFFGIQDDFNKPGELLLLVDHGVFYEFLPIENSTRESLSSDLKPVTLAGLEVGKKYALIISTESGLWRYALGDTVICTSISPVRISIVGRTKQYINVFGEELMIGNAEQAIATASQKCGVSVADFTVGPIFMDTTGKGCHEWIVEFSQEPNDMRAFAECLDAALREINSDYDAKRSHDMALQLPIIHSAPAGTFYEWLKAQGKTGGQNKVPRLSNTREYIEKILLFMNQR